MARTPNKFSVRGGKSFAIDIARFADKARGRIDLVIRKVALEVFREAIMRTPVDTGRARGNWGTAVDQIHQGYEDEKYDPSGRDTVEDMLGVVNGAEQLIGHEISLANNVPYILELEDGSSKRSPNGMVGVTLARHPMIVEQAVRDTKRDVP